MAVKIRRFFDSQKTCSCSMTGVWRAVACMQGIVVIFHSPRACTHIGRMMDIGSYYRSFSDYHPDKMPSIPLLCSQLEEKHAIFGGADQLRKCINYVAQMYAETCRCIVVANSCVSGVIGDDVMAVVEEAEEELGLPVLTVDCYGFLGSEFYDGYIQMTHKLVERFFKKQDKLPKSVVVLGDNGGPWNERNIQAYRILKALGLNIIGQFPSYMSLAEVEKVPQAEMSVIVGGYGRNLKDLTELAQELEKKYAIKALGAIPADLEMLESWMQEKAKEFACEEQAQIFMMEQRESFYNKVEHYQSRTEGKKAVICLGRSSKYFHPAFVLNTVKLLKMDLQGILFLEGYTPKMQAEMEHIINELTDAPIINSDKTDVLLQEADIVLTTMEINENVRQVYIPLISSSGAWGQLDFMKHIYDVLRSYRKSGGITYV